MKKKAAGLLFAFSLFTFLFSCDPKLDIPVPQPGSADFHKFIAVGGDYMSGFQDGALYRKGQEHSVAQLLSDQFKYVGLENFSQPLMPDNSGLGLNPKPWESDFVTASKLGYRTDCQGVSSLYPNNTQFNVPNAGNYLSGIAGNSFQDLTVPAAKISQYFDRNLGMPYSSANLNPYYYRFAGNSGQSTVYSDAVNQQAGFFSVWTGMEDIYDYAAHGGHNSSIMSPANFSLYLDTLISGLKQNGAKGVIANIPDLKTIPFYTTVPYNALKLDQNKADSLNQLTGYLFNFINGNNGFVIEYPNGSGMYRKLGPGEYILLTVPLDSVKCNFLGAFQQLPDRYVLDSSEVAFVNATVASYNSIIANKAAQYDLALVDIQSLFYQVSSGIKWNGADINSEFVSGGFFSLDGYHPHQQGYSIIANEFIKAINAKFGSTIPTVNCKDCDGVIFP